MKPIGRFLVVLHLLAGCLFSSTVPAQTFDGFDSATLQPVTNSNWGLKIVKAIKDMEILDSKKYLLGVDLGILAGYVALEFQVAQILLLY